ncbi:MAG: ParB/RepB/Spo0J family partition protein [Gammaproteobacteria bacterium]|nr:ParB/RepB/Spo0J family partition protein [Gammaproteobacteria bacterium]
MRQVPIDLIRAGRSQARKRFDRGHLEELAASIREVGVVQPVVLRSLGRGYELLAGERRWRAAQLAGLHQLPAVVRDDLDEGQAQVLGLVENLQRESLSPMETAAGLALLAQTLKLTHEQLGTRIGKSRVYVTNYLRLLTLEPEVAAAVDDGRLSLGHAKALAGLPPARQHMLAFRAAAGGWSVRRLEACARRNTVGRAAAIAGSDLRRLERRLAEHLGYPVQLLADTGGRGELRLRFASLDELDGLLARIGWHDE